VPIQTHTRFNTQRCLHGPKTCNKPVAARYAAPLVMPHTSLLRIRNLLWMLFTGQWRTALWRLNMHRRGVELSMATLDETGLDASRAYDYSNSGGPRLEGILKTLDISRAGSVIDVGCGKAGAMITLARYFGRVDGLELSERLVPIARENLRKVGLRNSQVFHSDAAEFTDFDQYSHIYLSNPFPCSVMRRVLEHVLESLERHPRELTVIYWIPVDDALLAQMGFRKVREFRNRSLPVAVYKSPARAREPLQASG
jgi:SAM-dependent methyltransferase